jgi:hypothetical protein
MTDTYLPNTPPKRPRCWEDCYRLGRELAAHHAGLEDLAGKLRELDDRHFATAASDSQGEAIHILLGGIAETLDTAISLKELGIDENE